MFRVQGFRIQVGNAPWFRVLLGVMALNPRPYTLNLWEFGLLDHIQQAAVERLAF